MAEQSGLQVGPGPGMLQMVATAGALDSMTGAGQNVTALMTLVEQPHDFWADKDDMSSASRAVPLYSQQKPQIVTALSRAK